MRNQTADVIAYNGKIYTQNEQWSIVEAVAIRDGASNVTLYRTMAIGPCGHWCSGCVKE
jgi:hypothetical protein